MAATATNSRPSFPGRASSTPSEGRDSREAIPPTPPPESGTREASSMSGRQTTEIVESLQAFVDDIRSRKDAEDGDSIFENVRKFARTMQQRVAKLGGTKAADRARPSTTPEARVSRPSISTSIDCYRPDVDVVAPISVRPNGMELLWVCGDCGEHYPRQRQCPESCNSCGAPKQNFYAPIED